MTSKDEATILSELYIERGIIQVSKKFDSLHVATASVYEPDYIVSYNFHHINRNKTRVLSTLVNREEGYEAVMIATAEDVLNYDYDLGHNSFRTNASVNQQNSYNFRYSDLFGVSIIHKSL